MPRILITGSTDRLGGAAARTLVDECHEVVLRARTRERASALADFVPQRAGVVIGDLTSAVETCALSERVEVVDVDPGAGGDEQTAVSVAQIVEPDAWGVEICR